jgi:hypothetical protein
MWKAYSKPESLAGIRRGTVRADYAAREHPKWRFAPPAPDGGTSGATPQRIAVAALVAALGLAAVVLLVTDTLGA